MTFQAVRFVLVGVLAGLVNVVARIVFNAVVSYEVAVVLALPVALTVAFTLNRKHVFKATAGHAASQYLKFAIVNILALAQVWLISVGLAKIAFPWLGMTRHADTVAHAVGASSPIPTSFRAYKWFVFAGPASMAGDREGLA